MSWGVRIPYPSAHVEGELVRPVLVSIVSVMLATTAMAADELPKELFLRCEVEDISSTVIGTKQDTSVVKEVRHFRLRDGVFELTSARVPLGTGCMLYNGEVACTYKRTKKSTSAEFGPSVEVRSSYVGLNRATGELRHGVDLKYYKGDTAGGTPSMTLVTITQGICRTIDKPLF
jgi:hypothetical protein